MIDSYAAALTLICLGAAVVTAVRTNGTVAIVAGVEFLLALQAILAVVGLARGDRPGEPGVFVAYLVTSVVVLPAAAAYVRNDEGRWTSVVLALAFVAVAVVVVRCVATWRPA